MEEAHGQQKEHASARNVTRCGRAAARAGRKGGVPARARCNRPRRVGSRCATTCRRGASRAARSKFTCSLLRRICELARGDRRTPKLRHCHEIAERISVAVTLCFHRDQERGYHVPHCWGVWLHPREPATISHRHGRPLSAGAASSRVTHHLKPRPTVGRNIRFWGIKGGERDASLWSLQELEP